MNIEIRLGNEKEIEVSHQLMIQAFEEYRTLEVPSSAINETVESMINAIVNGQEKFILYIEDGIPKGSIRFILKEDVLYFSRVSVPPFDRGKGIAKSMVRWLEEYANGAGKSRMQCRVRMALEKNLYLYESIGYSIVKEEVVTNLNGFHVRTAVMEKGILPKISF